MIVLNPFLDSLCNFSFKNMGLTPGIPKGCFQHHQDVVHCFVDPTTLRTIIISLCWIKNFMGTYIWKPKILSKCEFLFILQKKFCFKEKGGENLEESTKKMLKRNCNMVTLTANQMVLAQTQEDCCFTKKIFMKNASLGL